MPIDTDPPPAPYSRAAGSGSGSRPADALVRWYAVAHEPRALAVAEQAIRAAGFATYVPLVDEMQGRLRRTVPMFPGYLFASWADGTDWGPVARAQGVRCILSMDRQRPTPLRPGIVEALMESAEQRRIVLDPRPFLYRRGVALRVLRGPFLGTTGTCLWGKADRVALLMDLLGGPRQVVVPSADVALA